MRVPVSTNFDELRRRQDAIARKVRQVPLQNTPSCVAGVDAAFAGEQIVAAAVLYDLASLALLEQACIAARPPFPYLPGFLSFREGPALFEALNRLSRRPDLIIVDGQGLAHPRRCGLACHLGVQLGIPAIGCAKSRLLGNYIEPGRERGARSALHDGGEIVGTVLRTRRNVKPVFVSIGHLITLAEAEALVLRCTAGYRLPEPQRAADRLAALCKKQLADVENSAEVLHLNIS